MRWTSAATAGARLSTSGSQITPVALRRCPCDTTRQIAPCASADWRYPRYRLQWRQSFVRYGALDGSEAPEVEWHGGTEIFSVEGAGSAGVERFVRSGGGTGCRTAAL